MCHWWIQNIVELCEVIINYSIWLDLGQSLELGISLDFFSSVSFSTHFFFFLNYGKVDILLLYSRVSTSKKLIILKGHFLKSLIQI